MLKTFLYKLTTQIGVRNQGHQSRGNFSRLVRVDPGSGAQTLVAGSGIRLPLSLSTGAAVCVVVVGVVVCAASTSDTGRR